MENICRYFTESCKIFTGNATITNVYTNEYYIHRHFTVSWKIFTGYAIITDVSTDGNIPSVFYRELNNIYWKCHNHSRVYRQIHSNGWCEFKGQVLMHLWSRALADKITNELRKLWSVIKKISVKFKIYRWIFEKSRTKQFK